MYSDEAGTGGHRHDRNTPIRQSKTLTTVVAEAGLTTSNSSRMIMADDT